MEKVLKFWKKGGMWILLGLLVIFFAVIEDAFFTIDNLKNILRQVSIIGVAAVGISFALLTGCVDLSIGAIIALETVVCAKLLIGGTPLGVVIIIGILLAMVLSAINGVISVALQIPAFAITLATMNIYQGAAFVIAEGKDVKGFARDINVLANTYIFGCIPIMGIVFIVMAIIGLYILSKTYFGRYIYAMGGNKEAARLAGVNVEKYTILTHAASGIFYGVAGVLLLSRTMSAQGGAAGTYSFSCITAACLGGISLDGGEGYVAGAVLGILVMGVLENGMGLLGINNFIQQMIQGGILLFALTIDYFQKKSTVKA